ncbi:MAG: 30S ribosomal protein S16 [Microgenomates group bacterium]
MLKIKLYPKGKKHQRTFRIVIAESRTKFNGKFVDDIGFYTPQTKTLQVDMEKLKSWTVKGAQLTLGVDKLVNPSKYPKKVKVKPVKTEEVTPAETVAETVTEPAAQA